MGLPVYSASAPNGPAQPTTLKADPTAHARSAIRREPHSRTPALPRRPFSNFPPTRTAGWHVHSTGHSEEMRDSWPGLQRNVLDAERARNITSLMDVSRYSTQPELYEYLTSERHSVGSRPQDLMHQRSPRPRSRRGLTESGDIPGPESLPPLRRMSHRNNAAEGRPDNDRRHRRRRRHRHRHPDQFPPAPEVNGLGDRQRSWSPDSAVEHASEASNHDNWERFLSTITPDPSLPSASSSFASAAASGPRNSAAESAAAATANAPPISQQLYQPPLDRTFSGPLPTPPPIPRPYMATPDSESNMQQTGAETEECVDEPAHIVASPRSESGLSSGSGSSSSGEPEEHADNALHNDVLEQLMTPDSPTHSLSRSDTALLERLSRRGFIGDLENVRQILLAIDWASDHPEYHRRLLPLLRRIHRLGPGINRFFESLDDRGQDAELINYLAGNPATAVGRRFLDVENDWVAHDIFGE